MLLALSVVQQRASSLHILQFYYKTWAYSNSVCRWFQVPIPTGTQIREFFRIRITFTILETASFPILHINTMSYSFLTHTLDRSNTLNRNIKIRFAGISQLSITNGFCQKYANNWHSILGTLNGFIFTVIDIIRSRIYILCPLSSRPRRHTKVFWCMLFDIDDMMMAKLDAIHA